MKKNIIFIILLLYLFLIGCTKRIDVDIYYEVDEYSLLDSSLIGIPLEARINEDAPEDIEFEWHTEEGTFVIETDNQLQKLGKNITNDGEKIYWTVDLNEDYNISKFNISLTVKDLDKGKVIGSDSIIITATKNASFKVS